MRLIDAAEKRIQQRRRLASFSAEFVETEHPRNPDGTFRNLYHSTDTASAKSLQQHGIDPESLNRRDSGFFGRGFYTTNQPSDHYGKSIVHVQLKPDAKILNVGPLNPTSPQSWHPRFVEWMKAGILKRKPDYPHIDEDVARVTPGSKTFSHLEYNQEVGRFARSQGYDVVSHSDGAETVIVNPAAVQSIKHLGGLAAARKFHESRPVDGVANR